MYMYYYYYIEIKKKRNYLNSFVKKKKQLNSYKINIIVIINLRVEINKFKNMQVYVKNKISGLKKSY